ncbi:MAG: bifunctional adenosylcobinamide kinase/adenosylcobinamide-phosphate guanylyltransferase [Treponema sp.]|uniref:bifunctional adenosylcobinamide kinase/adenosylcobinamide-phosphate guanylyltransferase n=1 Tax=Treponema sp. TaxID=166 RepID=UPI0025D155E5|nr:bifunctional adenosylcobinamide kinase/adenosylcobinamide-phosphate guanylyltransferase [Treponema sp.]MBR0495628.1 bifunctional adenosylcobinamide kinase/adenosylcobinamide-phosphate guanylyltransferase [Treponema sp.]
MNILISGGCKNGKSSYAQNLAIKLAEKTPEIPENKVANPPSLIYFATMIPHDSEDDERIQKHREDRKNLGFSTVECGKNISEAAKKLEPGSVVLFDSLTALVANEMFDGRTDFDSLETEEETILQKLQDELKILMAQVSSVIFVTDTIFNDGKIYDKTTELYRKILAKTEQFVAKNCDRVVEMTSKLKIESGNRAENTGNINSTNEPSNSHLIIGGAYQGKTTWAKSTFMLCENDVFVCSTDFPPDFSKKCITHYENYIGYCLKNGLSPKTDFSAGTKDNGTKIIICDDIFCGVVPIDAFQRKLREETGLALQKIARKSSVMRIFCGIPQRIK